MSDTREIRVYVQETPCGGRINKIVDKDGSIYWVKLAVESKKRELNLIGIGTSSFIYHDR